MSAGPKPEVRQAPRERNSRKAGTGNSSSAPAERPPRRRDNGDSRGNADRRENVERRENADRRGNGDRREGGEHRDNTERREGGERGDRRNRPERIERPRRPQTTGPVSATERSKPVIEEKTHRPIVHVKGDLASWSTWAKNGNGPSFADMVRQRANAAAEGHAAKENSASKEEAPLKVQPEPVQQPAPAQAEESSEEEVVIGTVQPPAMVEVEPIPDPSLPLSVMAPHYVLEIERVVSMKLPPRVTHMADTQRGLYIFSAHAGKPPTPPPTAQQHAVYRPDTANLGARQWSLGTDSRIQQPPQQQQQQQQAWPSAGQFDYWNSVSERAPVSRPFVGTQAQAPYNSYPSAVPLSHQRAPSNAFPVRFRSGEVPEAALRQQSAVPFNRAPQQTNGGGVW
ncbi:hypothetical protein JKF63_05720 [Porcisia hertigi]|uniref:Uncharacterized protein n=1 Tax=Porcisia hertigi TaxID=2761500 RepID=A0A836LCH7_9TRYP|nr:hypothetical protein JKF63_05720 [Porcisia hertigi]